MNQKSKIVVGGFIIVMTLLIVTSCTGRRIRVGSLRTESETVELGDADSVDVEIFMGAGELEMSGGAGELLEADFTYNVAELAPEVTYQNDRLSVKTPAVEYSGPGSFWDIDDYRYEWDLRLNDDMPMDMDITIGAGRNNLVLGDLSLATLNVKAGAGDVTLDLVGAAALSRLIVEAGVGEITVDLSGDWQRDMDADIQAGVGKLTVILPDEVGVSVDVEGGISDINARGLNRDDGRYINDALAESEVTLHVDIQAGVGDINLEVGE